MKCWFYSHKWLSLSILHTFLDCAFDWLLRCSDSVSVELTKSEQRSNQSFGNPRQYVTLIEVTTYTTTLQPNAQITAISRNRYNCAVVKTPSSAKYAKRLCTIGWKNVELFASLCGSSSNQLPLMISELQNMYNPDKTILTMNAKNNP